MSSGEHAFGFEYYALPDGLQSPRILAIKNQTIVEIAIGDLENILPYIVKYANATPDEVDSVWQFVITNQERLIEEWQNIHLAGKGSSADHKLAKEAIRDFARRVKNQVARPRDVFPSGQVLSPTWRIWL